MFKPLNKDNIKNIMSILVNDLNTRLLDKELMVKLTDKASEYIADNAYDPMYGARPLKRYLQKTVETLVAKLILADEVTKGGEITKDLEDGELVAR